MITASRIGLLASLLLTTSLAGTAWAESDPLPPCDPEDPEHIAGETCIEEEEEEEPEPVPSCFDNLQNQDETDIDCGGSCSPCSNNLMCEVNEDCLSEACRRGFCRNLSRCGDGNIDLPAEECDDGALNNNDGCNEFCEVEEGWDCSSGRCSAVDTDADGLADWFEREIGTDPTNPDTDGDGFSDTREWAAGSDPLDPKSTPKDGTGCTAAGTGASAGLAGLLLLGLLALRRRR